jgi:hypothetical protein
MVAYDAGPFGLEICSIVFDRRHPACRFIATRRAGPKRDSAESNKAAGAQERRRTDHGITTRPARNAGNRPKKARPHLALAEVKARLIRVPLPDMERLKPLDCAAKRSGTQTFASQMSANHRLEISRVRCEEITCTSKRRTVRTLRTGDTSRIADPRIAARRSPLQWFTQQHTRP